MVAATADQNLQRRYGDEFGYPVAAGARVFRDTLVAVTTASVLVPAGTTGAVAIVGLAEQQVDNRTGTAATTASLRCRHGIFPMPFSGTVVTPANIGAAVYAVDDTTVSLDSTGGRLKAGTLAGIEGGRVWVQL